MIGPLVETGWLAERLGDDRLRIVDGSWYLPAMGRDALAEYREGHIPGAVFLDIDAVSDAASPLPHMLPAPGDFAARIGALGIGDGDDVVVYDGAGLFSAARVWWMLRAMGHDSVAVLNGGLPAWKAEGRPLESGGETPRPRRFTARPRAGMVRDLDAVRAAVEAGSATVLDARPAGRFSGRDPEPRAGLRSGHMPGATSTPIELFVGPDGRLPDRAGLEAALARTGADLDRPVITSCGSGITAAVPFLVLTLLGKADVALYDGSWAEWGGHPDTPVETG